jgi:hypothetical protein
LTQNPQNVIFARKTSCQVILHKEHNIALHIIRFKNPYRFLQDKVIELEEAWWCCRNQWFPPPTQFY